MSEDPREIAAQDLLDLLKVDRRQHVTTSVVFSSWEATLPPPLILEQYGQIIDNAPNRIFNLWEAQAHHRMCSETTRLDIQKSKVRISGWGLFVGSLLVVMLAGGGLWLIQNGHSWYGVSVVLSDLAVFAWVFVHGTKLQLNGQQITGDN